MGDVSQRQDNNLGLTENAYYDNDYRLTSTTLKGRRTSPSRTTIRWGTSPLGATSQGVRPGLTARRKSTRSPRQGAVLISTPLVRFRAISGSRERHIGSHIVEFYNVKDGSARAPRPFSLGGSQRCGDGTDWWMRYVDEYRGSGVAATVLATAGRLAAVGNVVEEPPAVVPMPRGDRSAATCAVSRESLAVSGEGDRV